uniref:Uncharacterized protein n=1 Tax=Acrobeloides nanus TaxID=290746 RepID=A0A914D4Q6_9BILA
MKRKCVRGKTVAITGGGSGIGQRLAEIFAIELGANVAILDIDQNKAENVASSIREKDGAGQVKAWRCDVSDDDSVLACAKDIRSCLGEVDIVICNAAILYFGHTLELDTPSLQRAFDVNVMGTLN